MTNQHNMERTIAAEQRALNDPTDRKPAQRLPASAMGYALKRAIQKFLIDKGTDRAAILTYFAVLSLAPTLLAVFSVLTLVLASAADTVENFVEDFVSQAVPSEYQALVTDVLNTMTDSASGGVIALIIGAVVALWSASAYVKAFSRNMNNIYGVVEGRSAVRFNLTMLIITLAVVIIVVAALVSLALNDTIINAVFAPVAQALGAESALETMTDTFLPVWTWVKYPVVLILVVTLVGVLYHFTGNVERRFRLFSIGAIFAVIGILVAGVAMVIYLTYFASYSSYGMIGTVMAVLFVVWVFNIVMFLGAEIDVEILRARQLVAGIPAEGQLKIRPRSVSTVEKQVEKYNSTVEDGTVLRRSLSVVGDDTEDE
ncbi:YihY/virulence factor BrkB family protein [Yaniella flava]|uniref:YihY/virulence factor BrkB family protein n=1 Tax=Yaniella flava TaxID=287930 RepID=A0ABP5FUX2_9MICC|nr:YihY/virulence factor BrkB family protein [Micrococcaceae bacterium]